MNLGLIRSCAVVLVCLSLAACVTRREFAIAPETRGIVLDAATGQPVDGAEVRFAGVEAIAAVTTGPDGHFALPGRTEKRAIVALPVGGVFRDSTLVQATSPGRGEAFASAAFIQGGAPANALYGVTVLMFPAEAGETPLHALTEDCFRGPEQDHARRLSGFVAGLDAQSPPDWLDAEAAGALEEHLSQVLPSSGFQACARMNDAYALFSRQKDSIRAFGAASVPAASQPRADALLITGVSIIDAGAATVSEPQDILVEGGQIVSVVQAGAATVPAGTRQIDGAGLFALPGLIDVHAHVGDGGIGPQDDATRARALKQFLRYGVTTLFVPGATGAGDADFSKMRGRCAAAVAACPGLYGSGSLITAVGSHPVSTIFGMGPETPDAVIEARGVTVLHEGADIDGLIAAKAAAGFRAIKIIIEDGPPPWYPRPRLTDEQISQIVSAADVHGLQVFAHISSAAQVETALKLGVDGIMHAPLDPLSDETLDRMAAEEMWYVPTFSLYDGILTWAQGRPESDPYALKGVDPSVIASLANEGFLKAAHESEAMAQAYLAAAERNLVRAARAGVPVALGSDVSNPFVYPGYSAHEELAWMVKAGLTPAQALTAATVGGASFLGEAERLGRIAPGYEADILLMTSNPLDDVAASRNLAAVISDGALIGDIVSED